MKRLIISTLLLIAADAGAASNQAVFPWDTPQPKQAPSKLRSEGEARWVALETSDRYTLYVDTQNVRKDGKIVQLATMYDLKTIEEAGGKPFRSVVGWADYDCDQRLTRVVKATAYSGNLGQATLSSNNDPNMVQGRTGMVNRIAEPGRWMPVVAESAQEIYWKYACAK
jgi:hypothetical protein